MARPQPTTKQVKAVRAVLYRRGRIRQMIADLRSIDVLMKLTSQATEGGGPLWVIPATGKAGSAVAEAAGRCRRIAAAHRDMSGELAGVALPAQDKRDLRTALNEQATVWELRGAAWIAPVKPDVDAVVAKIKSHQIAALKTAQKVSAYLRHGDDFSELGR